MEFIFLGTGTSNGVPVISCGCATCASADPRDKRTRSSLLVRQGSLTVLIDASTDLRFQFLREDIRDIDAVLLTHNHADHIYGLDDLRPINQRFRKKIPCYGNHKTCRAIRKSFPYFFEIPEEGGGVPDIDLKEISGNFQLEKGQDKMEVIPVKIFHGKQEILGFRMGKAAYITDASVIPKGSYGFLEGLDVLVLNALRYRPHSTHFSFDEAVAEAEKIKAGKTFLTHICHDLRHGEMLEKLSGKNIFPAYDGLKIEIFDRPCQKSPQLKL
jgi:phosphoribosyl 1,2-cyclic phosphate phosphodiesterase